MTAPEGPGKGIKSRRGGTGVAIGNTEIIVVILVVVLLFGASQIPKLARSLGRAQGEFQRAKRDFQAEASRAGAATPPQEEERRIRTAARELGIPEEGKPLDEVKRLLNERLT